MSKMLIGLAAFLALALVIGVATHWAIGVTVAVAPVLVIYLRLKLSSSFRANCDQKLVI